MIPLARLLLAGQPVPAPARKCGPLHCGGAVPGLCGYPLGNGSDAQGSCGMTEEHPVVVRATAGAVRRIAAASRQFIEKTEL